MKRRMRMPLRTAGLVLVAALALVAAALGACGGSDNGSHGSTTTGAIIKVTPPQTGTKVAAKVGDTVEVSLDANPTTGFEWTFTAGDTFTIEGSKYVQDPNTQGMAGAGGMQVVTLKVTKAGSSDLTGTYARGWETPTPGAEPTMTVTIVSTD